MSALCSTHIVVQTDDDLYAPRESITVRLSGDEKDRFQDLAEAKGMSGARLALIAIRRLLEEELPATPSTDLEDEPASERITIRLRPGDRRWVRERALERRMRDAGYLAALIRAHVVANPPLPKAEIEELKQAIGALVRAIADLSSCARELARNREHVPTVWDEVRKTRARVIALEHQFHDYTKAAVIAWEASSD